MAVKGCDASALVTGDRIRLDGDDWTVILPPERFTNSGEDRPLVTFVAVSESRLTPSRFNAEPAATVWVVQ